MSDQDKGGRVFLVVDGKVYEGTHSDRMWICADCARRWICADWCEPSTLACVMDPRMSDKVWKLKPDGKVT